MFAIRLFRRLHQYIQFFFTPQYRTDSCQTLPKKGSREATTTRTLPQCEMVLSTTISLEQLFREGREFKWEKPNGCPKCKKLLWGHGFSSRYFNGFSELFWIKRYRCSNRDCKTVIV